MTAFKPQSIIHDDKKYRRVLFERKAFLPNPTVMLQAMAKLLAKATDTATGTRTETVNLGKQKDWPFDCKDRTTMEQATGKRRIAWRVLRSLHLFDCLWHFLSNRSMATSRRNSRGYMGLLKLLPLPVCTHSSHSADSGEWFRSRTDVPASVLKAVAWPVFPQDFLARCQHRLKQSV